MQDSFGQMVDLRNALRSFLFFAQTPIVEEQHQSRDHDHDDRDFVEAHRQDHCCHNHDEHDEEQRPQIGHVVLRTFEFLFRGDVVLGKIFPIVLKSFRDELAQSVRELTILLKGKHVKRDFHFSICRRDRDTPHHAHGVPSHFHD